MERITKKNLEAVVERLNRITNNPTEPWTRDEAGKLTANLGNYHLSGAYGGYALHQMLTDGGGIRDLFGGHMPKRELYDRMHAYISGISDAA